MKQVKLLVPDVDETIEDFNKTVNEALEELYLKKYEIVSIDKDVFLVNSPMTKSVALFTIIITYLKN